MPVTLTLNELAVALRVSVSPSQPPAAPYRGILEGLLAASTATVDHYAPDAPTANQAVVLMAGYSLRPAGSQPATRPTPLSSVGRGLYWHPSVAR